MVLRLDPDDPLIKVSQHSSSKGDISPCISFTVPGEFLTEPGPVQHLEVNNLSVLGTSLS